MEIRSWRHAFKLDPDKAIDDQALERICESGTDAVIIGGTQNITYDNTLDLLARVRRYAVPCVLEVSNAQAIVPGFDHYFIPIVLNAGRADMLLEPHMQAIKELGSTIPWSEITPIGYCVLNQNSAVGQLTQSKTQLEVEDILAYMKLAYNLLHMHSFYIEYSGVKGDTDLLQQLHERYVRQDLEDLQLFYGGGITNQKDAHTYQQYVHTIVVGNQIYEDLDGALSTVWRGQHESNN